MVITNHIIKTIITHIIQPNLITTRPPLNMYKKEIILF